MRWSVNCFVYVSAAVCFWRGVAGADLHHWPHCTDTGPTVPSERRLITFDWTINKKQSARDTFTRGACIFQIQACRLVSSLYVVSLGHLHNLSATGSMQNCVNSTVKWLVTCVCVYLQLHWMYLMDDWQVVPGASRLVPRASCLLPVIPVLCTIMLNLFQLCCFYFRSQQNQQ